MYITYTKCPPLDVTFFFWRPKFFFMVTILQLKVAKRQLSEKVSLERWHWYRVIQLRSVSTRRIESKQCYLKEIISFIGVRVSSETDKILLLVGATESAAIFEQFPGKVSVAGMNISVCLIETIRGWNKRTSVVWKHRTTFLEPS